MEGEGEVYQSSGAEDADANLLTDDKETVSPDTPAPSVPRSALLLSAKGDKVQQH